MQVEILDVDKSSSGLIQFIVNVNDASFYKIPGSLRLVQTVDNIPNKGGFKLNAILPKLQKPSRIKSQSRTGGLRRITLESDLTPEQTALAVSNASLFTENFVLERIGAGSNTTVTSNEVQTGETPPVTTGNNPVPFETPESESGSFIHRLQAAFKRPEVIAATVLALSFIGFLIARNAKSKSIKSTIQNQQL